MDSLYAITIDGTMFYITGDLSEQECLEIEKMAKQFCGIFQKKVSSELLCHAFINKVQNSLHIKLSYIPLKYIFRIR